MDARIEAVRVAGTPDGPLPVVLLAVEEDETADGDGDADSAGSDGVDSDGADADSAADGTDSDSTADGTDVGSEVLPIFIGFEEAISIVRGLDAEGIGRPLTHDLTLDIIEELGGRVDRVAVSDVRENTYIAELSLNTPRDDVVLDARPSDALAMAARTNAPIEVARAVFEDGRRSCEEFEELDDIREVAGLYE